LNDALKGRKEKKFKKYKNHEKNNERSLETKTKEKIN
jgi:hypothetical protein